MWPHFLGKYGGLIREGLLYMLRFIIMIFIYPKLCIIAFQRRRGPAHKRDLQTGPWDGWWTKMGKPVMMQRLYSFTTYVMNRRGDIHFSTMEEADISTDTDAENIQKLWWFCLHLFLCTVAVGSMSKVVDGHVIDPSVRIRYSEHLNFVEQWYQESLNSVLQHAVIAIMQHKLVSDIVVTVEPASKDRPIGHSNMVS